MGTEMLLLASKFMIPPSPKQTVLLKNDDSISISVSGASVKENIPAVD